MLPHYQNLAPTTHNKLTKLKIFWLSISLGQASELSWKSLVEDKFFIVYWSRRYLAIVNTDYHSFIFTLCRDTQEADFLCALIFFHNLVKDFCARLPLDLDLDFGLGQASQYCDFCDKGMKSIQRNEKH